MKYVPVLLLSVLWVSYVSSQTITKVNNGRYLYQGSTYKSSQLEIIMSSNPRALNQYQEYLRHRKIKSNVVKVGLLSGLTGTVLLFYGAVSGIDGNGTSTTEAMAYTGLVVGSAGFLASLYGFFPSKHLLHKAVDIYNNDLPATGMPSSLSLGLTANGLGIVYSF